MPVFRITGKTRSGAKRSVYHETAERPTAQTALALWGNENDLDVDGTTLEIEELNLDGQRLRDEGLIVTKN